MWGRERGRGRDKEHSTQLHALLYYRYSLLYGCTLYMYSETLFLCMIPLDLEKAFTQMALTLANWNSMWGWYTNTFVYIVQWLTQPVGNSRLCMKLHLVRVVVSTTHWPPSSWTLPPSVMSQSLEWGRDRERECVLIRIFYMTCMYISHLQCV